MEPGVKTPGFCFAGAWNLSPAGYVFVKSAKLAPAAPPAAAG